MYQKYKKLTFVLGLFMLSTLLSACSGMFKPKHKTISYDEEVKLHNGEMIWVHIKRHYVLEGGGALGDPGAFERSYQPQEVEISWDTGFEGVGRKSVFFDEQIFSIDLLNNEWFVYGASLKKNSSNQAVSCTDVGTLFFNGTNCLVKINSLGQFLKTDDSSLKKLDQGNILYHYGFNETKAIEKTKISWKQKLEIQRDKPKKYQMVGKEFKLTQEK